jgi:hypothetical protein
MKKKLKKKLKKKNEQSRKEIVPNQVFVGCPWKNVRPKYEKIVTSIKKRYPLSFIIIGRDTSQDAIDLLGNIKEKLFESSYAIFDATGGNSNVSLEFGLAEANDIPRALYISGHKAASKQSRENPIISDLAGKRRNTYKNESSLTQLLNLFAKNHNYTKQFEKFLSKVFRKSSKGKKKRNRALALKIIHYLDGAGQVRRTDLVQNLLGEFQNYKEREIERILVQAHKNNLIICDRGRYSNVRMK